MIGPLLAGLDIGHSKCCLACAEADPRGFLRLIGIAERSLLVTEPNQPASDNLLQQTIRELVREFETKHEIAIQAVQLAINGRDIRGDTFAEPDEVSIPTANVPIHHLGLSGRETPWWNFRQGHIIHGRRLAFERLVRLATTAGLKVERPVFAGLASAYAVTRFEERSHGREGLLIADIGAVTTNYLMFRNGQVESIGVIEAGSTPITSEIASSRNVSLAQAEQDKISQANESPEQEIICRNLTDMFCSLAERVRSSGAKIGRVYVTGGGSRSRNIESIAAKVLGRPVYAARAINFAGLHEPPGPEYSTALGLLRYAHHQLRAE